MKTRVLVAILAAVVAPLAGALPLQPAHAAEVCSTSPFNPDADPKNGALVAGNAGNCTKFMETVLVAARAEKYTNGRGWETRGESQRQFPKSYGGYWEVTTSCVSMDGYWRTYGSLSALEKFSEVGTYNHQDRGDSGSMYADCPGGGSIPLIDP